MGRTRIGWRCRHHPPAIIELYHAAPPTRMQACIKQLRRPGCQTERASISTCLLLECLLGTLELGARALPASTDDPGSQMTQVLDIGLELALTKVLKGSLHGRSALL